MQGKGYWEDYFNEEVEKIPNLNKRIAAEVGADLKHRLEKAPKTAYYHGFYSLVGKKTLKEKLVDEALATIKRLSMQRHSEELVQQSRVTGKYGKEVKRDLPPQFEPITRVRYFPDMYKTNESFSHIEYPKEFRKLTLNNWTEGTPIPWGKFNTIFVQGHVPGTEFSHIAVLIRNMTSPISYTWYDSHGTSWRDLNSYFYPFRSKLNSIVGTSDVDFNTHKHQCNAPLCASFVKVRATYPALDNDEYNNILREAAVRIASTNEIPLSQQYVPLMTVKEGKVKAHGDILPPNMRETMNTYLQPRIPVPKVGRYVHDYADVIPTVVMAEKVSGKLIRKPTGPIPFVGGSNCPKCGLVRI